MPNGNWVPAVWLSRRMILKRRGDVYYLIVVEGIARHLGERIKVEPDERFFQVLGEHVEAYVNKGVAPPEAIASVVMNVGDDFMSGRDIVIRAGDYIAFQNFLRQKAA